MARPSVQTISAQLGVSLITVLACDPGWAQQKGYGQTFGTTPREGEIYDNYVKPGAGGGQPLSSPNILGVLERLSGAPAKPNPTPPGSAIDQAIRSFDAKADPAGQTSPPQLPMSLPSQRQAGSPDQTQ
ncbi:MULTISPECIES: hypothetical protein [unclassified Synechococcus]|uniref:hypothetical protein n=1 Tax=unclassified Synechococcus TaxID=2626047 RepID=UPI0021A277E4|nr:MULTISPECIES: hypothetical protein [unclassified Synechococcus]MCT0212795.1 hypothetical protein [Synechococcus sp. CS-1326]MCT0232627.1 hypothetical protein [Synechococcus sp. CS-1327]